MLMKGNNAGAALAMAGIWEALSGFTAGMAIVVAQTVAPSIAETLTAVSRTAW